MNEAKVEIRPLTVFELRQALAEVHERLEELRVIAQEGLAEARALQERVYQDRRARMTRRERRREQERRFLI